MELTRAAYWPSLAIMHIKYDMLIDLDEVVNLFEGPVYPSDLVLYVVKIIPPLRLFP